MKYYKKISEYIFDCSVCPTRCDGVSKGVYNFKNDVEFSEFYENLVINKINENKKYRAYKSEKDGYPDIAIIDNSTNKIFQYIEIKVQRRTFMSIKKHLPASNLTPSETLALNLSDLQRYFKIFKTDGTPINIMWVLLNRPCILEANDKGFYYQSITKLKNIYEEHTSKRRFVRKSGKGDVVAGVHKGVIVNYHFSLNELKKWNYIK